MTVFICLAAAGCDAKPQTVEGEKNISCELTISSGTATMTVKREGKDNEVYTCITYGKTLKDVLDELATETDFTYAGKDSSLGIYITKICGVAADYEKEQTWFAIYIGDEMSSFGISALNVEEGQVYKIILSK